MKRNILAALAAGSILLPACTGSVADQAGGGVSPAAVDTSPPKAAGGPIVEVVKRVLPAVVNVTTDQFQPDPFGGGSRGRGVGTGFFVTADGYIVTNYHVVENAQRIRVTTSGDDPRVFDARVVGGDVTADVAVLKVDADGMPTVPVGSSETLQLGQRVVAIGYALALEGGPTVTTGIVSSLDRVIRANDPNCELCDPPGVRRYSHVVQTDAAINPGNSGGPLVDLRGRVVGINSAGAGSAENIGFAIGIDFAWPIIREAIQNPDAPVAYLGVTSRPVDETLALQLGLAVASGAFVVDVVPGGPAERAGIDGGDVIVGLDGRDVTGSDELGSLIRSHSPGDRLAIEIVEPDGSRRTVQVALGVNPLP